MSTRYFLIFCFFLHQTKCQRLEYTTSEPKCVVEVDEVGFNYVKFWGDFGKESVKEVTAIRVMRHKSKKKMYLSRKDRYSWSKEKLQSDETYTLNKFRAPLFTSQGFRKGRWYAVCAKPTRASGCVGHCALIRFCDCNCQGRRLFLKLGAIYSKAPPKLQVPVVSLAVAFLPNHKRMMYLWDISVAARLGWLDCSQKGPLTRKQGQCVVQRKEINFEGEHGKVIAQAKTLIFPPPDLVESFDLRTTFSMDVSDTAALLKPYGILDENRYSFELPVIILERYQFRNTSVSVQIPFDNPRRAKDIRQDCRRIQYEEDKRMAAKGIRTDHRLEIDEYDDPSGSSSEEPERMEKKSSKTTSGTSKKIPSPNRNPDVGKTRKEKPIRESGLLTDPRKKAKKSKKLENLKIVNEEDENLKIVNEEDEIITSPTKASKSESSEPSALNQNPSSKNPEAVYGQSPQKTSGSSSIISDAMNCSLFSFLILFLTLFT